MYMLSKGKYTPIANLPDFSLGKKKIVILLTMLKSNHYIFCNLVAWGNLKAYKFIVLSHSP